MLAVGNQPDKKRAYKSRPIKRRGRRTAVEMAVIRAWIHNTLETDHPMTVRQVFYQLVSHGVIDKTENEHKQPVAPHLVKLRNEHLIPFDWIEDHTRALHKPQTFESITDVLQAARNSYRRAIWANQDAYVQVWLEKDALAGIVRRVTDPYDVPLVVTRGYASLSLLHEAAEAIKEQDKPTYVYYLGDHDPSGVDIPRKVEDGIHNYVPGVELYFERIAVTEDQIDQYDLPTRPTKQSDTRAKGFQGESVELDAISPEDLRAIVTKKITEHLDLDALDRMRADEKLDRENLDEVLRNYAAS